MSNEIYKEKTIGNKTVKIVYSDCGNPRENDNLGVMVTRHRNYTLGDEQINDPIDWLSNILDKDEPEEYSNEVLAELEKEFFEKFPALPLYMYEHSGITINTTGFSCRWDSGKLGYIYATPETIAMTVGEGMSKDEIIKQLDGEVKEYNEYVQGNVFGFQIWERCECCGADKDETDSCYGYLGMDFTKNGIADEIPEEFHEWLKEISY
jgi:hypothetical protein